MAKPWEQYAQVEATQAKPWEQYAPVEPQEDTLTQSLVKGGKQLGKGLVSGAADIGNTLINASTFIPRKIGNLASNVYGVQNPLEQYNQQRQQGLESFNQENKGSIPFTVGRIGGNIAGTMGAGGVIGKTLQAASKTPEALSIANAIAGGGSGGGSLIPNVLGGATSAATGALLVNPETVGEAAALGAALPVVGSALQKAGGLTADVIGGLGTMTGGQPLRTAASSGMRGGETAKAFTQNLRGQVPQEDVLNMAKAGLSQIGQNRNALYRSGMLNIKNDKTQLTFNGVDNALKNATGMVAYNGKIKNETGAKVVEKMREAVDEWKNADPATFHTPEGMDALKQRIGGIMENIPYEEKTARKVAGDVYQSLKSEINKQAPTYSKVMKDYEDASGLIKEIEGTFSLKKNANPDTAMRKLQSLMRNNVNTNYGSRLNLAKELEQQGGNEIMPAIAGQALSSITPRGLGGLVAGGAGIGSIASGNPLPLLALPFTSPRLMGEAAYGAGLLANPVSKLLPATGSVYGGLNQP